MGKRVTHEELPGRFYSHLRIHENHFLFDSVNSDGYGRFHIGDNKYVAAHRFAWELEYGPIPEGMTIDHVYELCQYKSCCNTRHMEVVTMSENVRRGNKVRPPNTRFTSPVCPRGCRCGRHSEDAKKRALYAQQFRKYN